MDSAGLRPGLILFLALIGHVAARTCSSLGHQPGKVLRVTYDLTKYGAANAVNTASMTAAFQAARAANEPALESVLLDTSSSNSVSMVDENAFFEETVIASGVMYIGVELQGYFDTSTGPLLKGTQPTYQFQMGTLGWTLNNFAMYFEGTDGIDRGIYEAAIPDSDCTRFALRVIFIPRTEALAQASASVDTLTADGTPLAPLMQFSKRCTTSSLDVSSKSWVTQTFEYIQFVLALRGAASFASDADRTCLQKQVGAAVISAIGQSGRNVTTSLLDGVVSEVMLLEGRLRVNPDYAASAADITSINALTTSQLGPLIDLTACGLTWTVDSIEFLSPAHKTDFDFAATALPVFYTDDTPSGARLRLLDAQDIRRYYSKPPVYDGSSWAFSANKGHVLGLGPVPLDLSTASAALTFVLKAKVGAVPAAGGRHRILTCDSLQPGIGSLFIDISSTDGVSGNVLLGLSAPPNSAAAQPAPTLFAGATGGVAAGQWFTIAFTISPSNGAWSYKRVSSSAPQSVVQDSGTDATLGTALTAFAAAARCDIGSQLWSWEKYTESTHADFSVRALLAYDSELGASFDTLFTTIAATEEGAQSLQVLSDPTVDVVAPLPAPQWRQAAPGGLSTKKRPFVQLTAAGDEAYYWGKFDETAPPYSRSEDRFLGTAPLTLHSSRGMAVIAKVTVPVQSTSATAFSVLDCGLGPSAWNIKLQAVPVASLGVNAQLSVYGATGPKGTFEKGYFALDEATTIGFRIFPNRTIHMYAGTSAPMVPKPYVPLAVPEDALLQRPELMCLVGKSMDNTDVPTYDLQIHGLLAYDYAMSDTEFADALAYVAALS